MLKCQEYCIMELQLTVTDYLKGDRGISCKVVVSPASTPTYVNNFKHMWMIIKVINIMKHNNGSTNFNIWSCSSFSCGYLVHQ